LWLFFLFFFFFFFLIVIMIIQNAHVQLAMGICRNLSKPAHSFCHLAELVLDLLVQPIKCLADRRFTLRGALEFHL